MRRKSFQIALRLARGAASIWQLIEACDGTILDTYAECRRMIERGEIRFDAALFALTASGQEVYGPLTRVDFRLLLRRYLRLLRGAPRARSEYFQQRIVARDVVRRLRFMYERGDVARRRLFILGDDDYFGLALALSGLPEAIVVGEIDPRVTGFIRTRAGELGLRLEVREYNAAEPLPAELAGGFDTFVTDPVETVTGFTATLSRGLGALRHPGAVYFGLTELECPHERWHAFQGMLNASGVVITDIQRDHSRYVEDLPEDPGESKLYREAPFGPPREARDLRWYRSSFIRGVTVRPPAAPLSGPIVFDASFYEDEYVLTR